MSGVCPNHSSYLPTYSKGRMVKPCVRHMTEAERKQNVPISQHDKEENPVWRAAGVLHDRQLSKDREGNGAFIQDRPYQATHQTTQDSRVYAPAGTAGGAE